MKLQEARFCEKDAGFDAYEINGDTFRRCPVRYITEESFDALSQYQFYKNGFLPFAGGFLEQPNKFIEQMRIIEAEVNKKE